MFVKLRTRVEESWSQIDVQLKRRVDLIPNLVETVKGYASHEKDVFENVTKARASLMSAVTPAEVGAADNQLSQTLKSLFAVAEAYPELKAQEGFVNLQKELSDTEDKVSYSRQFYNATVRDLNQKIDMFPSNLVASIFNVKKREYFEATEQEKEAVKVAF
ncbi:LemA family protein [Candidatus Nomurabacteria bacterium]|uniref:LemA family protein n=1 Tax=candidate division WWE3 bacterium TaxID=2053526 RepID=A0A955E2J9_UNCKA|nr:LemA family protein [candidate division WWE3 bacterium]MCB9824077.1 LemA family protein [Candidatus Nomurabacteria bacterium]MCB9826952.1 LemA family protein [Candidatus Nomurabacteria bacterium]MCB9828018.1 LemA family protein [Candidatus Nomurabacteria bacterium]